MLTAILLMDLHWGVIPPDRMREELKQTLFTKIQTLDNLDMIVIGGDLFDFKQYLSSDVTKYVIEFLADLLESTKDMGTHLYIIKGTRTHDDLQLQTIDKIFNHSKYSDRVFVYDTVREVEYKGHQILFIPEEYIIDQDEYYKDTLYSDKKYDLIFGHGMIDKIWYAQIEKDNQNDLTKHSSSPVFKVDNLEKSGRYVYFGHIHIHKNYGKNKRFQYVGPFTRWEFGKDDDVGFDYIEYDKDTGNINEEFVVNEMAQVMGTRVLNIKEDIELSELNDMLNSIISKEMVICEKLRVVINLNSKLTNFNSIRDFIITKIGEIKFVKLILSTDIDTEYIDELKDKTDEVSMKRKYLFGDNMSLEERIKKFLQDKKGLDISTEDIKSVLNME